MSLSDSDRIAIAAKHGLTAREIRRVRGDNIEEFEADAKAYIEERDEHRRGLSGEPKRPQSRSPRESLVAPDPVDESADDVAKRVLDGSSDDPEVRAVVEKLSDLGGVIR